MGCISSHQVAPAARVVTDARPLTEPAQPSSAPPPCSGRAPAELASQPLAFTTPSSAPPPPAPPLLPSPHPALMGLEGEQSARPSSPLVQSNIPDCKAVAASAAAVSSADRSPALPPICAAAAPLSLGESEPILSSRERQLAQLLSYADALRAGVEAFLRYSPTVEELVALKAALGGVMD
eukprot:RCo018346